MLAPEQKQKGQKGTDAPLPQQRPVPQCRICCYRGNVWFNSGFSVLLNRFTSYQGISRPRLEIKTYKAPPTDQSILWIMPLLFIEDPRTVWVASCVSVWEGVHLSSLGCRGWNGPCPSGVRNLLFL